MRDKKAQHVGKRQIYKQKEKERAGRMEGVGREKEIEREKPR